MYNAHSYKRHRALRSSSPEPEPYPHFPRPRGLRSEVCASCRTIWPCAAYVTDLHAADAALRAFWRENELYAHAAALV